MVHQDTSSCRAWANPKHHKCWPEMWAGMETSQLGEFGNKDIEREHRDTLMVVSAS